jgi:hypothetical protein
MFRAMRVGEDLRTKALLALEEVLQETRYGPVEPSRAVGFALAYLLSLAGGSREPFVDFWRALSGENPLHRFGYSETALKSIYRALGVARDEEATWEMWRRAQERERRRREQIGA